jgi:CRP-like cAMP-binding protein
MGGLCARAGDVFYVIEEGTFTIFDNAGAELARIGKGSCFGELALLREVRARTCMHAPQ